ncbi:hypothetical protein ABIB75_007219 [Bradyrhizobium sp. GM2.2]|uniref:ATP-binding protein n=1 Tax=Bradyrhizobium sp. GM2.2 TaxID=3156358 RepID=UPI003396868D
MIQIEEIEIVEFRGIRHLKRSLGRRSFGIAGPNGTGKSGIVDAIEFALTGNITRLGGAGTAELSVKAHAPHVGASKKPETALVRLQVYAPALKKSFIIERSVKNPGAAVLKPSSAETMALLAQLETHPEFALSRREIIKYILVPAGKRSQYVQELLRLDQLEKLRVSLQRVANDAKRDHGRAEVEDRRTKSDFFHHLGIATPNKTDLLASVNARRAVLKLDPVADLAPENALKVGINPDAEHEASQPFSKLGAKNDLASFLKRLAVSQEITITGAKSDAVAALAQLTDDPALLRGVKQRALVERGLELVEGDACPLCDGPWEMALLATHLQEKIAKADAASTALKQLALAIDSLAAHLRAMALDAGKVAEWCEKASPPIDATSLRSHAKALDGDRDTLDKVVRDPAAIAHALQALGRLGASPAVELLQPADRLAAYIETLSDPSKAQEAKEFLIVAQEKYDQCRGTQQTLNIAAQQAETASAVFSHYGTVSTAMLEGIYDKVQKDFTEYYSFINRDDEANFEGKLSASFGKLAFDVDFYGRGRFPPGAYHSEGHQDGMGLCLYLALVKHTLGDGFTLAVLDDVLMSVDAGHRREVCALLKQKFPNTQFVLTTHDGVWLKFMQSEKLVQSTLSFGGWTVDSGPQVWNEGHVWTQIQKHLANDNVFLAAGTLRRYLEFTSTILADNLRARIEYHGNGQYDLGDLWPGVLAAWKARLKEARDSASSWGKNIQDAEALQIESKKRVAATKSEEWMINKAVHYNAWADLQSKEFAAVVSSFQQLLQLMQCPNTDCGEFLCVSPIKGDKEVLRCSCSAVSLNLVPKKN